MEEILDFLLKPFNIERRDTKEFSPLVLAYIGDAVYELIIRSILVSGGNRPVNKLNKDATSLVKAGAQAQIIKLITSEMSLLSLKEAGIHHLIPWQRMQVCRIINMLQDLKVL